eukprot:TRINITY_DN7190_c0_g1_i1.p1 TRINITY_DN7190_c0_g1~~TRINITY_DN7190_c0_g1_i1.p1  ORF type:complete len:451 (+),score=143.11 TRINITY_DN7190_c0_g1_i1:80-1432(+)
MRAKRPSRPSLSQFILAALLLLMVVWMSLHFKTTKEMMAREERRVQQRTAAQAEPEKKVDLEAIFAKNPPEESSIEPLLAAKYADRPKSLGGAPSEDYLGMVSRTGCDVFHVPFNPALDEKCIEYMSNAENWRSIEVVKQTNDARTLKFTLAMKEPLLKVLAKLPQKGFAREPAGEVAGYHMDRMLGVNRIPPVAHVFAPMALFVEALREMDRSGAKVIPKYVGDGVNNYEEWGTRELSFAKKRGLEIGAPEGQEIPISFVPMVADVHKLLKSELRIPYIPHNASWMRHLDPRHHFEEEYRPSFLYLMEVSVFDYVIGNRDRSPNKNSFVVGGGDGSKGDGSNVPAHPGHPTFIWLDNGMAFGVPDRNPIMNEEWGHMCIFPKWLVGRIHKLRAPGAFRDGMKKTVKAKEPEIWKQFTKGDFENAEARIQALLARVQECLGSFPEKVVLQ